MKIKYSYGLLLGPIIFAVIALGFYPFLTPILSSQQKVLVLLCIILSILLMTIPIVLGLILVRITIDGSQLLYRGYFRHQAMNISDIKSITFRHIYMSWSTIVINFQDNTTPAYAIWSHGFTYKQMENLFDALNVINPNISTQILNGSSKVLDYFKLK